jgi:hypothetical protein
MRKDLLIHDVLGILRFKSVGESLYCCAFIFWAHIGSPFPRTLGHTSTHGLSPPAALRLRIKKGSHHRNRCHRIFLHDPVTGVRDHTRADVAGSMPHDVRHGRAE